MLARPPPTLKPGTFPPTMQQQSQPPSQNYPNQYQQPVLPPNFQENQQNHTQPSYPVQSPGLPPNFAGNQQHLSQVQHPSSSNPSGSSEQFHSHPPMMANGMNQPPPQHGYPSSGVPPTSAQMPPPSMASNQYGPPPTNTNPSYPNLASHVPNQPPPHIGGASQYKQGHYPNTQPVYNGPPSSFPSNSQPAPPLGYPPNNQLASQTGYPLNSQPVPPVGYPPNNQIASQAGYPPNSQPPQTGYPPNSQTAPPVGYPPNNQSAPQTGYPPNSQPPQTGYPPNSQPPQTGYPSQSHYSKLSGPPSMPNNQLNGPNTYPGQPPLNAPGQQPMAQSRIDPNVVPNVIQVLELSQEKTQEPFITNAPGLLPPLAATNYVCQDQGGCNPRFMRSTVYSIPNSSDMVKQSHIPIALAISPLASLRSEELEPPLSSFGEKGPVRCHRCKAYMCSFMQFIDGGKRFLCCFCEAATDVPDDYFNHLDHSGRRMDWFQRPELCLGSYETAATKQYCKDEKWPEPPAFLFMIDASYNSVRSGLLDYICHILKTDLLDYLPKEKNAEESTVRVGFATFDKKVHFYNIKNTLGQPQMMVVSDLEDIFVPLLDGLLCTPQESRGVINSLLDQIPQTFANTQETETILAPVLQAGIEAFKSANCCGKIYVFSTTLPIAVAPGKLSNREDKKMLGTDKEKVLLAPVNNIYTKLGEECAQNGCGVDLFVFSNNYLDLATIGEVCRVSGGQIYKYNYFSLENTGECLSDDLKRNFQRTTVFDALMRVRTSAGIRPVDFLGNFYMTNATEMIFGTIDADKSVSIEIKHDDKLAADSNAYTQVALLYTSISGQRRLRILTLALTTTSSFTSLYPLCDLDTILNYIIKVAVRSITISTPKSIQESIITQAANMLACYRKNCAQSTAAGQLILPDTLKLLPIYTASLIKSDVLVGTQTVTTDDRNWLMHRIMSMNIKGTSAYLYPRVYPLHDLEENQTPPPMVRCLYERFSDNGAYVVENGLAMYIWLGSQIDATFVQYLFGLQTMANFQPEKCRIEELDNPVSKTVRALLKMIRDERNAHMRLLVIRQRDSMEPFFKNYLVEDKGFTGGASYVDFLYHLHREIRNILQ